MNPLSSIASIFVGKGSFTDMGDRYPILDKNQQSSIEGLYVVGDISGTPDIKAAINSGHELASHLASAHVDFDGRKALVAAAELPPEQPLDDAFAHKNCSRTVEAVDRICTWCQELEEER